VQRHDAAGANTRTIFLLKGRRMETLPPAQKIHEETFATRGGDRLWRCLVRCLPARLRYWAVVDAWAQATDRLPAPVPAHTVTVSELVGLLDD
jgi:hypothetical protein